MTRSQGPREDGVVRFEPLDEDLMLSKVGRDLTYKAQESESCGVYGRGAEVEQLIRLLCRQGARNTVLIGPSGVGKTAVVEALAFRISRADAPPSLCGTRIIETSFMDIWSHVGSSDNWAGYGNALRKVMDECERFRAILFMDELHMIFGHQYSISYLRPRLARGMLTIIGATTEQEYLTYIDRDKATSRRFQTLRVEETSEDATVAVLGGVMPTIRKAYGCWIEDPETQRYLVQMTDTYIPYQRHPAKAVDIMHQVAVAQSDQGFTGEIGRDDVLKAACAAVGAQEEALLASRERLAAMEFVLNSHVLGQPEAIARVCRRLFVSKAGVSVTPDRPDGVFLFAGPTGVGKTELAKALTAYLTGHEKNLIRLDMSAYHSVYSLIGVPGEQSTEHVQDVPLLTRALRANPYSVLLLDEIEKADRQVWMLFLQAFDSGRITDSFGNEVFLKNTVVIMTCNVGFSTRKAVIRTPGEGLDYLRDEYERVAMTAIGDVFPREFLGRVDDILLFKPLTADIMQGFVEQKVAQLERIIEKPIRVSDAALSWLREKGFSAQYGARELNRAVDDLLGYKLAQVKMSAEWSRVVEIRVEREPDSEELSVCGVDKKGLEL